MAIHQDTLLHEEDDESESTKSVTLIEILQFVWHATKRHPFLAFASALLVTGPGVAFSLLLPPKYDAESRILHVQSSSLTSALSTPDGRALSTDAFGGATELLMQKASLEWIVAQSGLVTNWKQTRAPVFRVKDRLNAWALGPLTDSTISKTLVDMLRTTVYATADSSVLAIHVRWRTPEGALAIARAAQARFFDVRRAQEFAAIEAAISLNEQEAQRASDSIAASLDEVLNLREQRKREARKEGSSEPNVTGSNAKPTKTRANRRLMASPPASTTDVATQVSATNLASRLSAIRQRVTELEGPWQRRLADLRYQLNDLRATYGPEHPAVRQQEVRISEASQPPPELASLHANERHLMDEIESAQRQNDVSKGPVEGGIATSAPATSLGGRAQGSGGTVVIQEREEDPVLAPANARLASAIAAYDETRQRLENARMQLAASQVAFDYRYVVVTEPERPRTATSPNRPLLVAATLSIAILVGLLAGALRDLLKGKVFEPWQLRVQGLDVLGQLTLKDAAVAIANETDAPSSTETADEANRTPEHP